MAGKSIAQGGRIIVRAFKYAYDYIGMTMILSAIWFLAAFMPTTMTLLVALDIPGLQSFLLVFVALVFLFGPITTAVYSVMHSIVQGRHVAVREFFTRLRRYYGRALRVSAVMFAILAVLIVDVVFFMQSGVLWMEYLGFLWIYLIVFWLLMLQYLFPIIVRDDRRIWDAMKVSALLTLDNIVVSLMLLVTGTIFVFLSSWLRVPVILFLAGTLSLLHCIGIEEVIGKYKRTETESDQDEERHDG